VIYVPQYNTPIEPERTPEEGYHLREDLGDKAIAWICQQKAIALDKPFFVYGCSIETLAWCLRRAYTEPSCRYHRRQ